MTSLHQSGSISPVVLDSYGRAIIVACSLPDGSVMLSGCASADDQGAFSVYEYGETDNSQRGSPRRARTVFASVVGAIVTLAAMLALPFLKH